MLNSLLQKLSEFTGFNDVNLNKMNNTQFLEEMRHAMQDDGEDLREYLLYRHYDEDRQIFINDSNYLGFILEMAPLVGIEDITEKNLEFLFNMDMPYGMTINFLLLASHDINNVLKTHSDARINTCRVIEAMYLKKQNLFKELANDFNNQVRVVVRDYRIYINCSTRLAPTKENLEKFLSWREVLCKKLESLELAHRIVDADELIELVEVIVQMSLPFVPCERRYNKHELLDLQMLKLFDRLQIKQDCIEHGSRGLVSKIYEIKDFPREFNLNSAIELLGSGENRAMNIPARFIISCTITNDQNSAMLEATKKQARVVIKEANGWLHKYNHNMKTCASEWSEIASRIEQEEKCLTLSWQIMLTAPGDVMPKAEQALLSLYNANDFKLGVANRMQLVLLQSFLPMQQSALLSILKHFRLTRAVLTKEAVALLPIHAEWKGMYTGGLLLVGRRGQVFNFDPFVKIKDGNFNVCVFAPPGGGKSVFLQALANVFIAQNTACYVLDIGRSFVNSADIVGGSLMQFGKSSNLNLNPFAGLMDNRELLIRHKETPELLTEDEEDLVMSIKTLSVELLATMCNIDRSSGYLMGLIDEAMYEALLSNDFDLDLNKFVKFLKETTGADDTSEDLRKLAKTLFPYTGQGRFAKYFASGQDISFSSLINVFEFEEIKDNRQLLAIVLQCLTQYIIQPYLTGDRQKRFTIIVDEAWMLLEFAPKFWATLARTLRKYNGSLMICVQGYKDLHKESDDKTGDDLKTILDCSSWKIVLKQNSTSIEQFKKNEGFNKILPLIKSLSFEPGKYSELLIYATGITVVGRLILDNFCKIAYSTDGPVFYAIHQKKMQGKSTLQAIEELVYEKYGDVPMFDWSTEKILPKKNITEEEIAHQPTAEEVA